MQIKSKNPSYNGMVGILKFQNGVAIVEAGNEKVAKELAEAFEGMEVVEAMKKPSKPKATKDNEDK